MSQIAISGNASGTGVLTIASPNTNSNYTLTLPTATTTVVGTDATQSLTNKSFDSASVPTVTGTAPLYFCRAWANFNGTGTIAIRASGNVSSITDLGAGLFQVNFTTAMADANYSAVAAASSPRDAAGGDAGLGFRSPTTDYTATSSVTASSVAFSYKSVVGTLVDPDVFTVTVFR